ncbi:hypothetical protein JCM10295v2_001319 [Rhodotorula toruloides]
MRDVFCKIEAKGADARLKDPLLVSKANVDSNCDNLTDNESAHSKPPHGCLGTWPFR